MHPSPRSALHLVELDECCPLVPVVARGTGLLALLFVAEARSVGDGRLRVGYEAGPALRTELHIEGNLGAAFRTVAHETPHPRRPSCRRTRASSSSGESESPSHRTSSARIRSI